MMTIRTGYQALIPAQAREAFALWRYNTAWRFMTPWFLLHDDRYRDKRGLLEEMRGEFEGHRCVVMGNGPSLNQMDLARFESEFVWASNRAYLLFDRISWRPSFWVAVDRRVVPDIALELMELQEQLPATRFFYPDYFLLTRHLRSFDNTFWFRERREPDWKPRFSLHPPDYLSVASTVTVSAIQLAVFMGFNPIYLIGCDTSYSVPATTKEHRRDPNRLISTEDNDPNHFDPRYFGAGKKWHQPHTDRMIWHYQRTREITRARGIEVVNATVGGSLEVFPRIDYRLEF